MRQSTKHHETLYGEYEEEPEPKIKEETVTSPPKKKKEGSN